MLHLGGEAVSFEELRAIPVPARSGRYRPVPHYQVVGLMRRALRDQRSDVAREEFRVARGGRQALLLVTGRRHREPFGFAVAVRSSTDKSLAMQCAVGAVEHATDNLALRAHLAHRRHTTFVWENLVSVLGNAAKRTMRHLRCVEADALALRSTGVHDELLAAVLGIAMLTGVMTARQVRDAFELWTHPPSDGLRPRTAWAAYSACSTVLKAVHPSKALDQYVRLHQLWTGHRTAFGRKLTG